MSALHCRCCQHYQDSWRVGPASMFPGWFEATPPTNDTRHGAYFPNEEEGVAYARRMRDNPGLYWPGVLRAGRSFREMLWLRQEGLLDAKRIKQ